MRSAPLIVGIVVGSFMQTAPASAQGLLTVRELSLGMAMEIAQGALDHCRKLNARIGVSVVDRGGHVLVTLRDDGAAHHTVELAQRKAYTARIFRQTTREFVERIINNPRSQGLKDTTGALASFGGVPIKVADETIGGVGVSGAPGGPNDEACAVAGIERVADRLK
jgi:uncharacterized protein GlcG (DUF336 family)